MKFSAKDYISTGFSAQDAEILNKIIQPILKKESTIIIDFDGITIFTTLFFNNLFAKYVIQIGPEEYNKKFKIINLSNLGGITYKHSYENAIRYYNLSDDDRDKQQILLSDTDEI